MQANSTDKRSFQLVENNAQLGEIVYENLFFTNAKLNLPEALPYEIKPVGFFSSRLSVTQNGQEIASLAMTWSGHIAIQFANGEEFVLKLSGFFQNNYTLENKNGEKLIQFEPKFNWRSFHYMYNIHYNITLGENPQNVLLVLLGVYSCNYFIACMSGANVGMA